MPSSRSSSSNAPLTEELKAIVFDLDGTIYDNHGLALQLMKCNLLHLPTLHVERRARREVKSIDYGTPEAVYKALFDCMARKYPLHSAEHYARWFHEVYMAQMTAIMALYHEPRPLFAELVEALHARGMRVFVYSDYEAVAEKLAALQLDPEQFDGLLDAPQTGGLKPCREAFARMLETFGCEARTTLMVGDRQDTDGVGAASVGMPFYNIKATPNAWDLLLKHFL